EHRQRLCGPAQWHSGARLHEPRHGVSRLHPLSLHFPAAGHDGSGGAWAAAEPRHRAASAERGTVGGRGGGLGAVGAVRLRHSLAYATAGRCAGAQARRLHLRAGAGVCGLGSAHAIRGPRRVAGRQGFRDAPQGGALCGGSELPGGLPALRLPPLGNLRSGFGHLGVHTAGLRPHVARPEAEPPGARSLGAEAVGAGAAAGVCAPAVGGDPLQVPEHHLDGQGRRCAGDPGHRRVPG
ncbi:unnamed protein product, partial [Effrenium voratum]